MDAPADKPAYKTLETQVMMAFEGMPGLETPVTSEGRVFQLVPGADEPVGYDRGNRRGNVFLALGDQFQA